MSKRLELHSKLLLICENVYFQPPDSIQMKYPCIIYKRQTAKITHANNLPYINTMCYQITVVDANPDSKIPSKIAGLQMCKFDRHYTADNLNHDVYNIYY